MGDSEFSVEQFDAIYPAGIERHYWDHARNMVLADIVSQTRPSGVLEVGAGTGIVTFYLRDKGLPVWGVEPAPVPVDKNRESVLFSGKKIADVLVDIRAKIDTVLLLDVIEHINDPSEIIAEIQQALPHVSRIIITVPARQELWSSYDTYYGHFLRYDRPGLKSLMSQNGWETETCAYYFHALYAPAFILAKLTGARTTKLVAPSGWRVMLHTILAALFYWEYKILPGFLVGSSIVGVFKKSNLGLPSDTHTV